MLIDTKLNTAGAPFEYPAMEQDFFFFSEVVSFASSATLFFMLTCLK